MEHNQGEKFASFTKTITKDEFECLYLASREEQEAPPEHCSGCGTRTGGGRCMTCENLRQRELRGE